MNSRSLLLVAAIAAVGFSYCAGSSNGAARERGKVIDSVVKARTASVAKSETVYVRGKDRWLKAKATWDTVRLTDTLPVVVQVPGKPDTVQVFVSRAAADSVVQSCQRLIFACDARNAAKDSLIAGLRAQVVFERQNQRGAFAFGPTYDLNDGRWGVFVDRDVWRFRLGGSWTSGEQGGSVQLRAGIVR